MVRHRIANPTLVMSRRVGSTPTLSAIYRKNTMELKPTKNYKMTKQTKRSLARYIDPHERGVQKRLMIQAELASAVVVKSKREDKK